MDRPCPVPTGLTAESAMRARFTDELRGGRACARPSSPRTRRLPEPVACLRHTQPQKCGFPFLFLLEARADELRVDGSMLEVVVGERFSTGVGLRCHDLAAPAKPSPGRAGQGPCGSFAPLIRSTSRTWRRGGSTLGLSLNIRTSRVFQGPRFLESSMPRCMDSRCGAQQGRRRRKRPRR